MKLILDSNGQIVGYTNDPLFTDHDAEVADSSLPTLAAGESLTDYTYISGVFTYVPPSTEEPTPAPITQVTLKEFKSMFTGSELRAFATEALTNDTLFRFQEILNAGDVVDLTHTDTLAGMAELVSTYALTQTRSDYILGGC